MASKQLPKTIVLVGLMGCGKSSVGTRLAKQLGVGFIDLDHEIEAREGMSVSAIFSSKGEAYFRSLERSIFEELLAKPPFILASGGGAFIQEEIRSLIKQFAISVWLKADFDVLFERVSRKTTRPLLEQGDKAMILKDLMDKRYPIYATADITVESKVGPHQAVINQILTALGLATINSVEGA